MIFFSLILGCVIHTASAHPVDHHVHYSRPVYVSPYSAPARRWVSGYWTRSGIWVPGYWVTYAVSPVPQPPLPAGRGACHTHRDGRVHCGAH